MSRGDYFCVYSSKRPWVVFTFLLVFSGLPVLSQQKNPKPQKHKTVSTDTLKITPAELKKIQAALKRNQEEQKNEFELNEVVITASESKGLSSSSIIDHKAMQHLQPSSFADLLELLPGGRSKDPNLTSANLIRLREVGIADENYDISSLGTAFYIDGAPINTRANMQYTTGFDTKSDLNSKRNITGKGVDMRSLSTDQIEKVEVVRGIPSVQYGNLTSGLVKIERKQGISALEARFKADGFSKLFYVGKGFEIPEKKITLNAGIDYLNSVSDPRDRFENYKRLNASVRLHKLWESNSFNLSWNSSLDYGGSFDNQRTDPDAGYQLVDRYQSSNNRMAFNNNFTLKFNEVQLLKSIDIYSSLSLQRDKIDQTKWVQAGSAQILPITTEQGAHDAPYLTPQYTAHLLVDGKPVTGYLKAMANLGFKTGVVNHRILLGAEGNYSKNNGLGQVYNPLFPPSPGMTSRPRAYNDIPASEDLSFFAEDQLDFNIGRHEFKMAAGLRSMAMFNLPVNYKLNGQFNTDPRINAQWTLPKIDLGRKQLVIGFGGGFGWQTMFPVTEQLYPDYYYKDLVQLNYYHNNPAYRRANLMTYKILPVNKDLVAARNKKWELRTDISIDGNRLSLTYFQERLTSGFRKGSDFKSLAYQKYNTANIDPNLLTGPPALEAMEYENLKELIIYNIPVNGSALTKEGIEYQFTSRRIKHINTRITLNGAWFKSVYENSLPVYKWIKEDLIIDGKKAQYAGLYPDNDGFIRQQLNTNMIIDTYIPKIGFEFSTAIQCQWFSSKQNARKSGTPSHYIDVNGNQFPYTEADKKDKVLQWLNTEYSEGVFEKSSVPMNMNVNFKASRNFKDKIRVSMFVNRIFNYAPDYVVKGVKIRRSGFSSPYFGMELNFNI
ncbi:hypothetical protein HDE68_002836 [Pedobacter cryoconitis]|uniref:TonB-dependent receptor plug domain-containing protein n=1 Tax=Pedobacter cryoconitis TaxID=188932 RepID=A0A7W9DZD0_9SPHI|nr:TonB-dependent receptor plug domain-containing protein [Pedobacter cryoconitis]MBB5636923.1 hypothetical protein [Pedobacter cryoconitis]